MNFCEVILSFDHLCHNLEKLSCSTEISSTKFFDICTQNLNEYVRLLFSYESLDQKTKENAKNDYMALFLYTLSKRLEYFIEKEGQVTRMGSLRLVPERLSRLAMLQDDCVEGVLGYFREIFEFLPLVDEGQFIDEHYPIEEASSVVTVKVKAEELQSQRELPTTYQQPQQPYQQRRSGETTPAGLPTTYQQPQQPYQQRRCGETTPAGAAQADFVTQVKAEELQIPTYYQQPQQPYQQQYQQRRLGETTPAGAAQADFVTQVKVEESQQIPTYYQQPQQQYQQQYQQPAGAAEWEQDYVWNTDWAKSNETTLPFEHL